MKRCWCILFTIISASFTEAEDLRLLDLPPPEADQYIESKDQTLKYAPKIESNVPAVRVLGKTPTNVLEDVYLANQYHGQDGLGSYLYGYSVPDIAKTEKKKAQGDLRGAYQYINGGGQEIKVQYWDDGTGFHQVDNLPEVLPKQVPDSPDVQAAKEEFFKRWHEEAERNTQPEAASGAGGVSQGGQPGYVSGPLSGQPFPRPGSNQGQYQQGGPYLTGQPGQGGITTGTGYQSGKPVQGGVSQGQASGITQGQPQGYLGSASSGSSQTAYQLPTGQGCCSGQSSNSQGSYGQNQGSGEWEYKPTEEEKGPPRGFFYNVDYPVGIIVQKQGAPGGVQKRESLEQLYANG
ncbi:Insect cuticle protein, partial [Oryctes borbonicus]